MYNIKSISILTPCHQSWQQMETKENGRHCAHCAKIVVDFSKMTNTEILDYLASSKDVCGRLNEYQLSSINYQLGLKKTTSPFNWKSWLVAAGLLGAGFFNKVDAQAAKKVSAARQPFSKSYSLGKLAPRRKALKHSNKKIKPVTTETGDVNNNKADLVAYRADISNTYEKFKPAPEPEVRNTDLNASIGLKGMLGGISMSGVEVNTPSRVEMLYQYMRWPINKLFK